MRGYWRLLKLLVLAVGCTAYASVLVRLRPKAERPALRAYRQKVGTGLLCRAMKYRVSMQGTLPINTPMLYVCNHLSAFDPLLLGSQMPVAFAGKAEIKTWPLLGWVCHTHGMLFVDRDRRSSTISFVEQVEEKLRAGVSVVVFPEGTTGWGDIVQGFKTGAFEAIAEREEGAALPLFLDVTAVEGQPMEGGEGRRMISHNGHVFVEHCKNLLSKKHVDVLVRVGEPVPAVGRNRKVLARLTHHAVSTLGGLPVADGERHDVLATPVEAERGE